MIICSDLPFFRTGEAELSCTDGALLLPGIPDLSDSRSANSVEGRVTIRSSESRLDRSMSKSMGFGVGHQPCVGPVGPSRAGLCFVSAVSSWSAGTDRWREAERRCTGHGQGQAPSVME